MDIRFRYVPLYFEQSFADDPRYARIAALVDKDRCDVILLDKTTQQEAFYSASNRWVDALAASGADAYSTPVDFAVTSTREGHPLFLIHFHDHWGQDITWQFVSGDTAPHATQEVLLHTDNSGVTLLYAPRRAAGVAGTTLTIAGREYLPASTQSNGAPTAFEATDMTVAQIFPGTDLWNVESSPADTGQGAEWSLSSDGGRRRVLWVKELSDTEATVFQIDPNDPDAPRAVLNVVRDTGEVRSVSFESHFNTLWIFFGRELPLPVRQIEDTTTVTFSIAENEQADIASGELQVRRAVDAEHVLWRFDAPDSARGAAFETGANLIPGPRTQANCEEKDCSALR